MQHDFDLEGVYKPDGAPASVYNPADYGLPVWRDEDHLPPETEAPNAEAKPGDAWQSFTVEEAKRKFCTWLASQIGEHERANNWNKYAENPDLTRMYGWNPQNQPWCDIFYDAGMIECFGLGNACTMTYQPMGAGSALCKQSAQYYMDAGAFFKTPEVGDQIFFYRGGSIEHTGGVIRVYGGSVVTVEGNSSDQVAERVYSVGDNSIAGYGRPKWSVVGCEQFEGIADYGVGVEPGESGLSYKSRSYVLEFPYLQRGSTGEAVTAVQIALMGRGFGIGPDGADGDFGGNTEEAVKEFQLNVHLTPDGIVGPDTGAALFGADVGKAPEKTEKVEKEAKIVESKASNFLDGLIKKIRREE